MYKLLSLYNEKLELIKANDPEGWKHVKFEEELLCKDGSTIWTTNTVRVIPGPDKQPINILGTTHDITDRKQAEEALRRSEMKFRGLVEASSDWIWEVNREGVYTYASPQVKEILGYEPEEVIGKTPFDLMSSEESGRVAGIFNEIVSRGEAIISLENINLHKNSNQIVLETSGVLFFNESGDVVGYRGIDRDITVRKNVEKALLQEKDKLQDAMTQIKTLGGLLPICASCKKIRDDKGYWNQMESYIENHSDAAFSHGICPDCSDHIYGKEGWYVDMKKNQDDT